MLRPLQSCSSTASRFFLAVALGLTALAMMLAWTASADAAVSTKMVKDIRDPGHSFPMDLTNVGGTAYFSANDGTHGGELWKSDGTAAGTTMVADIATGSATSNPTQFIGFNGDVYFYANDATHGYELWRTDGTEAGTSLVKDIRPGSEGSRFYDFSSAFNRGASPVVANGRLFFTAYDGTHGFELWSTDGTEAGTQMVKDINPSGSDSSNPFSLTAFNGRAYFTASDGTTGVELYSSDGTESGTALFKDINVPGESYPYNLTVLGGKLYFTADNGVNGTELWSSNGTAGGTAMLADIRPGLAASHPSELTNVGGTLYFAARDDANGQELWKSDGTEGGTTLVEDVYPGNDSYPHELTNVDGVLFFLANDASHGQELWKSDGTEAGTTLVEDLIPGNAWLGSAQTLVASGGKLFFTAQDPSTFGFDLWTSDGTEDGTGIVEITPGRDSSAFLLTDVGGQLFFRAEDGTHGQELWRTASLPTAANDSVTVNEDAAATTVVVLANDTDPDGDAAVASKSDGAHGTVAITNSGADLTYTPAANYCGADTFTYALNGGSTATVAVTVTCVDDSPTAANDSKTLGEDAGASTIDVLTNDSNADGGTFKVDQKTDGDHGTVAITNSGADLAYTPEADYCGPDTFTYTLNGGSIGRVSVTVTCVNDDPTAVNDTKTLGEDAAATTIDVLANDTDPDTGAMTVASKSNGSHGTVAITNAGASLTYTPEANYCGTDSFTYTLNGGSTATVAVTVTCVDDPVTQDPTPNTGGDGGGSSGGGATGDQTSTPGTDGGDVLAGSDLGDLINGLGGADLITGGLGDDQLIGGDGADRVTGGGGNDLIRGGDGPDKLDGGPGNDTVFGGRGDDKITADDGERDEVSCGKNDDTVFADSKDEIAKNCEKVR